MCGIAGIVAPASERHRSSLERMVASLRHRGPDDEGTHFFDGCALGHTRLSSVDLAGSRQPMLTPDGQTAVSFNGEIYNYKELRAALPEYPFRTGGDTELLLALYERDGTAFPERLPGMFAFAIWDERRRRLFCARDRFGEKPFHYAIGRGGEFVFASEIKAVLASGLVGEEIDGTALRHYLQRGYIAPNRTVYRNIHTLPPAHRLVVENGTVAVSRYWTLPAVDEQIGLEEAVGQFQELMDRAVARQLVADVPVGAFLSGGLDSSTIVAVASRHHRRLKTFSFGFGKVIDELPFAREIATRYETDHHEFTDGGEDIAGLLQRMQSVYDEPFADSSNIPTYLLSGAARQQVTVALAGEGADEMTAGYSFWYRPLWNLERARGLPAFTGTLLRIAALGCKALGRTLPARMAELREGFFLKPLFPDTLEAHRVRSAYFTDAEIDGLGLPGCGERLATPSNGSGGLDGVLGSDLETYLPGDILTKTDRASMAWGLEMRCPFLDVDLASFCIRLPSRLKIDSRRDKIVLREAFGEAWTPSIRSRSKQGFGASVQTWLRQPAVADLTKTVLADSQHPLYQWLDPRRAAAPLQAGDYRTWNLLVLALWLEHRRSA